jgi:diacylglycerol kinase family enzyme
LVYVLFGLVGLFRYSYPVLSFRANGTIYQGSTGVVAKSRLIAGPFFALSPKTDLAAPMLTLCLLKAKGPIGLFWTAIRLTFLGNAGKWIEFIDAPQIDTSAAPEVIQSDGEVIGPPPALFTLSEKPLYLIYPV